MAQTDSSCPHCHAPVTADTRFCGNCGKAIAQAAPSEKPAARTMLGIDPAALAAAAEKAKAAAAQAQAAQAQAPAPQPTAAAPAAKAHAKTMLGISASELAGHAPAAAPAPQPTAAAAPAAGNKQFAARTMIGAAMASPAAPAAQPAAAAAPAQSAKHTMIGGAGFAPPAAQKPAAHAPEAAVGGGRTMLGVPLSMTSPEQGVPASGQVTGTELDSFARSPGSEPPSGAYADDGFAREARNDEGDTLSIPRPRKNPMLIVALVVGLGLVAAAGFMFMRSSHGGPHSDVTAKIVTIDTGEALLFEVPSAPAGSKVRFGGQEKPLQAGRATFALAADSLRVGDNVVLADVVYPDGTTEPARITLAVFYRIWVDTAALRSDKSSLDVVVTALPGTRITLDGEDVKLDAEGRATRSYPLDVMAEAKGGMIDHVVHYRVQPPSGETVVDELHTQLPVAGLQIDRPGRQVVTVHESIDIAGAVGKDTQVSVDGVSVPVKDGRFRYRFPLPQSTTYKPRVVASAAGKAPTGVTLEIRRVESLAAAENEFGADRELTYAKLAPNPAIYRGQKIALEGRVYATDARGGEAVIQVFARPCPSSQRCSVWISDPTDTEVKVDDWIRVLGSVEGEQQFRSEKNDVVTVPKIKATFILPAKP